MGQCICKERSSSSSSPTHERRSSRPGRHRRVNGGHRRGSAAITTSGQGSATIGSHGSVLDHSHLLVQNLNLDIRDLILETLTVIRTLVNNEQEPPAAMYKLNLIADRESGWLHIVQSMIDIIPADNPLGPAVITLFLDESPLPTKETVCKLLFYLNLSADLSNSGDKSPTWHRNCCIVLGCIAEKLAGPNSVATFKPSTLEYLVANMDSSHDPSVILFSLIALEKYAQTSENKSLIARKLTERTPSPLQVLEPWLDAADYDKRQVGFCAQWSLDNMFIIPDRPFSYETVNTHGINVMLNHNDVSEYLKISPNGLGARCDVSTFESVRCTFQVDTGIWFYEALIITPGVMQIGWATKDSKFLNHEGYGIGDDEFSVAYDGCRQLLWHNASSQPHTHDPWKAGDILGCLLDLDNRQVMFYLNGMPLRQPHIQVFDEARSGFFAAASFMSFQQCQFNFGHAPFVYPPSATMVAFQSFNDHALLTEEQRIILPRHKVLERLRQCSVPENSCSLCFSHTATVTLKPCGHSGFCTICSMVLEHCPLCRGNIEERYESLDEEETSSSGKRDSCSLLTSASGSDGLSGVPFAKCCFPGTSVDDTPAEAESIAAAVGRTVLSIPVRHEQSLGPDIPPRPAASSMATSGVSRSASAGVGHHVRNAGWETAWATVDGGSPPVAAAVAPPTVGFADGQRSCDVKYQHPVYRESRHRGHSGSSRHTSDTLTGDCSEARDPRTDDQL